MAHTKQTARKHHESPKKTNAVKKLPIKKNAGKKLSRYVTSKISTLSDSSYSTGGKRSDRASAVQRKHPGISQG